MKTPVVIDVREAAEFSAGHLLNARHIPLGELEKRLGDLDKIQGQACYPQLSERQPLGQAPVRSSPRPASSHVHNLEGGIEAWVQAGMPISRQKKK